MLTSRAIKTKKHRWSVLITNTKCAVIPHRYLLWGDYPSSNTVRSINHSTQNWHSVVCDKKRCQWRMHGFLPLQLIWTNPRLDATQHSHVLDTIIRMIWFVLFLYCTYCIWIPGFRERKLSSNSREHWLRFIKTHQKLLEGLRESRLWRSETDLVRPSYRMNWTLPELKHVY